MADAKLVIEIDDTNDTNDTKPAQQPTLPFDPAAVVAAMAGLTDSVRAIAQTVALTRTVAPAHGLTVREFSRYGKEAADVTLHFANVEDARRFAQLALLLVTPKPADPAGGAFAEWLRHAQNPTG